jgi:hypothetical protein
VVNTKIGDLKPWDTIIAIKPSEKEAFVDVDSWAKVRDLILAKQLRGESRS